MKILKVKVGTVDELVLDAASETAFNNSRAASKQSAAKQKIREIEAQAIAAANAAAIAVRRADIERVTAMIANPAKTVDDIRNA